MGTGLRVLGDCKELFKRIIIICDANPHYKYTLNPQMIRACVSIGSNITEGSRRGTKEFSHFLNISLGSADELKFQLSLLDIEEPLLERIIGQIVNLKKSLHPEPNTQNPHS